MVVSEISYENHICSKTYCEVISKLISIKFSPLKTAYTVYLEIIFCDWVIEFKYIKFNILCLMVNILWKSIYKLRLDFRKNYMLCMYICRLEIQSRKFLPKLNLNEITKKVIGFNDLKKILVEDQLSPTCTLLENTRNFSVHFLRTTIIYDDKADSKILYLYLG